MNRRSVRYVLAASALGGLSGFLVSYRASGSSPLDFAYFAVGGALLLAGIAAWSIDESVTAALIATLVAGISLAIPGLAPQTVLALGLATASLYKAGGRASDIIAAALAAGAGLMSVPLGVVAVGALWWRRSGDSALDLAALGASVVVLAVNADGWIPVGGALFALAIVGILFRRPVEQRVISSGARFATISVAAAIPAMALLVLTWVGVRTLHTSLDDIAAAAIYAAAALVAGLIGALALVGIAVALSTRTPVRTTLVGLVLASTVATAVVGRAGALGLLAPAALGLGVGVHLISPASWRAKLKMLARG